MTARDAVRAGRAMILEQRRPTVGLALAAALAVLIAAIAGQRAGACARLAIDHGDPALLGRALLTLLVGGGLAGLLVEAVRAVALARHAGGTVLDGLQRTPAMISVVAVELTVEGMLLFGVAMVLVRGRAPAPSIAALQALLVATPALVLCAAMFAAARVAVCLAARGVAPAPAIAQGFDFVARRWRALAALVARLALSTLPLTLGALALWLAAARLGSAGALVAGQLRAMLLAVAWLWSYAALGALHDA